MRRYNTMLDLFKDSSHWNGGHHMFTDEAGAEISWLIDPASVASCSIVGAMYLVYKGDSWIAARNALADALRHLPGIQTDKIIAFENNATHAEVLALLRKAGV